MHVTDPTCASFLACEKRIQGITFSNRKWHVYDSCNYPCNWDIYTIPAYAIQIIAMAYFELQGTVSSCGRTTFGFNQNTRKFMLVTQKEAKWSYDDGQSYFCEPKLHHWAKGLKKRVYSFALRDDLMYIILTNFNWDVGKINTKMIRIWCNTDTCIKKK